MIPPKERISRRKFFKYCFEATEALLLPDFLRSPFDGRPILQVETTKPYVAVTIDDGVFPKEVERFLSTAAEYKTKCTVFPVGGLMRKNPSLWREVASADHEIGNHSHSHLNVSESTKAAILRDFSIFETEDYPEVIGSPFPVPGLARVPYALGPINVDVQKVIASLQDLHVHWRIDSYSWKKGGQDSNENLAYVMARMAQIRQGDIIILHFNPLDITALPYILDLITAKGLENVTFSTLWHHRRQIMKKRTRP
ncbi:hypothetical protein A3A84_00245 [Candidatus Collierbacteria bacterium RIFCSPLOWO2_01_FULL_50_23]|uniref:NodB homology domain-containing protein n=2 Tax=Candidatus Collieribacteriota TaxID=1752725 RepID=A0A1F5EVM8_9BACT|nr:MAG: hypothetical protein A3D09_01030 [Candidatus Collierbacteria bacterium RIFCSPHIGHO2_02_FULL_49_10]OGD71453.1 MAG: hypothetical protein A2703_03045 [Candidatus Collierbacteria bacterium RIFCSPHIGHO2_01_FULL_50_25]OGD74531.1 MAG: hypothetical protein A3A84_00245 [Candidatus Collierbacteria bacterium RIFCSPLOWO2_01_FULL_50_23]